MSSSRFANIPLFVRDGLDLHCEVPITFSQAALGGVIEVPTLEGKVIPHTLKRGVQTGDEARIYGLGMPNLTRDGRNDGRKGDLVLHLKVVTPRKLTKRQEELLRELGEIDGANVSPEHLELSGADQGVFQPLRSAGGRAAREARIVVQSLRDWPPTRGASRPLYEAARRHGRCILHPSVPEA